MKFQITPYFKDKAKKLIKNRLTNPLSKIVFSFIMVIFIGFLLLMLPFATKDGIAWYDALFTSFSAVCVTGLAPVADVSQTFSWFGITVIGLLIQIGGLGFVTIAVFVMRIIGSKIGFSDRVMMKEALNQTSQKGIVKLVTSIIKLVLVIEGIAFLCNLITFVPLYGAKGIPISLFHAVSTFNNAGFDILGDSSLISLADNPFFVVTTALFIILGGLGFIVINDILDKKSYKKLTIHSKIVIKMTIGLVLIGTALIKFSESISGDISWLDAFFQSVTTRTAGFATISFAAVNGLTLLIIICFMIVGASPSSTGGGIKTTTLYTIVKTLISFATGKRELVYSRQISKSSISRAFILFIFAVFCIIAYTFLVYTVELIGKGSSNVIFEQVFFEISSAFGTVGLSTGITPGLEPVSKLLISSLMFVGRLGPLTMLSLMNFNYNRLENSHVEYLEENIIIG